MNHELPDVQAGFTKGRGTRDQIANIWKFYKDVLEVGELAKLAYFNDITVGAVCCRVDHSQNQRRLYIMTLGCLAPSRRLGIGTKMLNHVLNICEKDGTFDNIYL